MSSYKLQPGVGCPGVLDVIDVAAPNHEAVGPVQARWSSYRTVSLRDELCSVRRSVCSSRHRCFWAGVVPKCGSRALRFQGLDLHWPEFFKKFCRDFASLFNSLNIFLQLTKYLDVPNPECGMSLRFSIASCDGPAKDDAGLDACKRDL